MACYLGLYGGCCLPQPIMGVWEHWWAIMALLFFLVTPTIPHYGRNGLGCIIQLQLWCGFRQWHLIRDIAVGCIKEMLLALLNGHVCAYTIIFILELEKEVFLILLGQFSISLITVNRAWLGSLGLHYLFIFFTKGALDPRHCYRAFLLPLAMHYFGNLIYFIANGYIGNLGHSTFLPFGGFSALTMVASSLQSLSAKSHLILFADKGWLGLWEYKKGD